PDPRRVVPRKVEGRENIPQNTNFIVVSNHCSHLDYGLVAYALGKQRRKLYVMAASDYFFNSKLKRTYYQKCTHILPMNRETPLPRALPVARACLASGNNLLVFPEGTRSLNGQMARFKRMAAFLCLQNQVDVLPLYLSGTFESLPKGNRFFRSRHLGVRIGPVLRHEKLAGETLGRGMKFSAATVRVTEQIQRTVEALRDGAQG
ncbi:MAG: lysophospholipid acyltransferase family protein, partial [Chloroflexota bacterium]